MNPIRYACIALAGASLLTSPALPQTPATRPPEKHTEPTRPEPTRQEPATHPEPTRPKTEKTRPESTTPVRTAKTAPALTAEQREIAKKAVHFESVHRDRTARMNRLIRIYKQKGDEAKVRKLEEMKAKEEKRTVNALAGFREKLGDAHWQKLDTEMKRHR